MKYILIIIILISIIALFVFINNKKKYQYFNEHKTEIVKNIESFYDSFLNHYIPYSEAKQIKKDFKELYEEILNLNIPKNHQLCEYIQKFLDKYINLDKTVDEANKLFIKNEKEKYNDFLSNIVGRSLDEQQRDAVVHDEDYLLLLAGAGAGKTLTIEGRIKYLCEIKKINPKDILYVTFGKKAEEEIKEKMIKGLGYSIKASTYHALGSSIIRSANKGKRYVVEKKQKEVIGKIITRITDNDKQTRENLIKFFAYYLNLPADLEKFDSLEDAYKYERSKDLETVKLKFEAATYAEKQSNKKKKNKNTLEGEKVESLQEVIIANFLFLHGIEYEYEKIYPHQDDNSNRRAYMPDFYLPDYDIYLEHFGINKEGKVPWLKEDEEKKYIDDMNWKIDWHKKHNTKLLKTYSFYYSEGILLKKLEEMLIKEGVKFKNVNLDDIFYAVYKSKEKKYFSSFIGLCERFIKLFKLNGNVIDDLDNLTYENDKNKNGVYFNQKIEVFKEIIKPILIDYEDYLKNNNRYDFADMINLATKAVEGGYKVYPYKYIFIDEFQDTSLSEYNLIKAIINQTKAKLLCVGDDWQSIYRFKGSNVSLFTSFEKNFEHAKILRLEKTYRNSQQLIDAIGNFMMKNNKQMEKKLISDKRINDSIQFWFYKDNKTEILEQALDKIIELSGEDASIYLLGRTGYDHKFIEESKDFNWEKTKEIIYKKSPKTPISFYTIHAAKGLEADNIVILNFENSTMGFPNKLEDDPVIELVLEQIDDFPYAEERRLFYVAVTRTRNRVFVLTDASHPSEFLSEMPKGDAIVYVGEEVVEDDPEIPCPLCKKEGRKGGRLITRYSKTTGKEMLGCTNYKKCEHRVNNPVKDENGNYRTCPRCGGILSYINNERVSFITCSNYWVNGCRYTEKINSNGNV